MIIKEYRSSIDIHKPKNYFDRFYSYVWKKHFPDKHSLQPTTLDIALNDELRVYNATLGYIRGRGSYILEWESEDDYLLFVLRWA